MSAGGSVLRRMNAEPGLTVLNEAALRCPRCAGDEGEVSDTPAQVNRPRHDRCSAHRPVGSPRKSRRGEQHEWGQGDVIERTPGHPNPGRRRRQAHDAPVDARQPEGRSMPQGEQGQPEALRGRAHAPK